MHRAAAASEHTRFRRAVPLQLVHRHLSGQIRKQYVRPGNIAGASDLLGASLLSAADHSWKLTANLRAGVPAACACAMMKEPNGNNPNPAHQSPCVTWFILAVHRVCRNVQDGRG